MLVVPEDFSKRVKRGEPARLAVWAEGANLYVWGIASPDVVAAVGSLNAELLAHTLMARGLPPAAAAVRAAPIATGDRNLFHPTGGYGRYFVPGILLIVIQQAVVVSMAFSAGVRRELGLDAAARWPMAVGLGRALAHAPFWLGGVALVLGVVMPHMGWSGPSAAAMAVPFLGLVAVLVPVALSIATLVRDRLAAFQLLMFFSAPLFVASGFTWPASQLPAWVRVVTAAFPATPALRALRVLAMKSASLADAGPELLWLGAQFVVASAIAAVVVHRSWRRLPGFPWGLGPAAPAFAPTTRSAEVAP
jgi:ABC-2 type transport system permease protein